MYNADQPGTFQKAHILTVTLMCKDPMINRLLMQRTT